MVFCDVGCFGVAKTSSVQTAQIEDRLSPPKGVLQSNSVTYNPLPHARSVPTNPKVGTFASSKQFLAGWFFTRPRGFFLQSSSDQTLEPHPQGAQRGVPALDPGQVVRLREPGRASIRSGPIDGMERHWDHSHRCPFR